MTNYLGEVEVDWRNVEFYRDFTEKDWTLLFIKHYGGIDGAHHKDWVLDQVVRILTGAPIKMTKATWDDGRSEYRFEVGESDEYIQWVKDYEFGEDGEQTYEYTTGITP